MTRDPPAVVRDICEHLLIELDAAAPGLVSGFHLTGSAVLGDWRAGDSDIDFVGVLARPASAQELSGLDAAVADVARGFGRQVIEGLWLDDLSAPPSGPGVDAPVALRTLALHGVAIRGEIGPDVWNDAPGLRRGLQANLDDYWAPWVAEARRPLSRLGLAMLGGWAPAWGMLGLARLIYTLQTDDIVSKTDAGRWAMAEFPGHLATIAEALRQRTGEGAPAYGNPFRRRREALAAMAAMLSAGRALR